MKVLLFFGLLFLGIGTVHAQADCPPGTIPYGSGQDLSNCGPDNSRQNQPAQPQLPPVRWQDQWGVIATDNQLGKVGASINEPSKSSAEFTALDQCQSKGGTQCKVLISFYNQCGVMIIGNGKISANSAATVEQASEAGLKTCRTVTTNCHVYYSACSLPKRIQ